jgi:hypothetical protein
MSVVNQERTDMNQAENKQTAQNMITLHGLRAAAVVQERIAEARQQNDTAGLERWQNVETAIAELRRSGAHAVSA